MRSSAKNAISVIAEIRSDLNSVKAQFEEGIIINGKPFDDGKISDCLAQLQNISNNYSAIANYCTQKIIELKEQIALRKQEQLEAQQQNLSVK
jgi:hypothetical protein